MRAAAAALRIGECQKQAGQASVPQGSSIVGSEAVRRGRRDGGDGRAKAVARSPSVPLMDSRVVDTEQ